MTLNRASVLEINLDGDNLRIGFFDQASTVQFYEGIPFPRQEIEKICGDIISILHKAGQLGVLAGGTFSDLRRHGQSLFHRLLPPSVQQRLLDSHSEYLILQIDETLVPIPWELLFDGRQFLCLRFNTGRRVKTRKVNSFAPKTAASFPLKMLILADPKGDLPAAAQEAKMIRREMDSVTDKILVASRIKNIPLDFAKNQVHEYDIVHYAGHAEYDFANASQSGWVLADGKMTIEDILALGPPLPGLVFMNSCQSAFENQLFGLANAFLMSGVRHVIGTLWKVGDEAAMVMAKEFYRQMAAGRCVGRALRESRLKLIQEYGQDYIAWSSYVLYGDPEFSWEATVPVRPAAGTKNPVFLKALAGIGGLVVIGLLFGVVVPVAQFDSGRGCYIKEDYRKAAGYLARVAVSPYTMFSLNQKIFIDRLLGNAYAMAEEYDQSMVSYQKALNGAISKGDKQQTAVLYLALAETAFAKNMSIDLAGTDSRGGERYPPREVVDFYQKAFEAAQAIGDIRSSALALQGIARVEQHRGEWGKAARGYEQAVVLLETKTPSVDSDRLALLNLYLALAQAYVNYNLNFEKTLFYIGKFAEILPDGPATQPDRPGLKVLQRRFELFLQNIAEKGYKNSDLYKRAGKVYNQFQ